MKTDTIWSIRSQLNGCYMPDNFALFSSRRMARQALAEMRRESIENGCTTQIEHSKHVSYLFIREEWQEHAREHDSFPYMHVLESVSWKDIAQGMEVKTRQEVLENYDGSY